MMSLLTMTGVVCCVCRRGPADVDGGVTIYRINPKGQPGIWACDTHRPAGQHIDPEVREIIQIIEDGE